MHAGFENRKAPDDVEQPEDQPAGGYRQDVPPVKPGMGPEVSPDESNSEVGAGIRLSHVKAHTPFASALAVRPSQSSFHAGAGIGHALM